MWIKYCRARCGAGEWKRLFIRWEVGDGRHQCDYSSKLWQIENDRMLLSLRLCLQMSASRLGDGESRSALKGNLLMTHAQRFNEHNWRAMHASGLEAFNSPGVHSREDKWGESYPQSGPNEKSAGDAHILSGKIEQNKSPQSPLKC